jgi:hypothetical protein
MSHLNFYFPIPDDEIIYSVVARYALLSGYTGAKVMHKVFGNSRKRIHPYLPGLIEKFSEFYDLTPNDVINNRTIFPLLKYTQPSDILKIKATMLNQTDDKVLLTTALARSRFRLFYGLNCCPICIQEDKARLGFSYWHIGHQIPGVQICHLHGCILHSVPMGEGNKDRSLFLPPNSERTSFQPTRSQVTLAQFANNLFTLNKTSAPDYKTSYQFLLTQRNLQNPNSGRLKMKEIVPLITEFWRDLPLTDHIQAGVPACLGDFKFLGGLLREKNHSYCHPIKHVLFACWLTDGNAQRLRLRPTANIPNRLSEVLCKNKNNNKIVELLKNGFSMHGIYKITGKSRCYIKRIAKLNNIPHRSNALSFSIDLRRSILIKALFGVHRKEIASVLSISTGFVEQVISNEPNMVQWRKHLMIRKRVMMAYRKLQELKQQHPTWNRTDIRKQDQSAYFLLYNNARSLIENVLPKPLKPNTYAKDWKAEDIRIYNVLLSIDNINSMSVSEIDRRVNGHGNLLRNRKKLPQTAQLLYARGK